MFLAVAAYDGLGAGFGYALFHYGQALQAAGIATELAIYSGNCHVDDSRNRLVRDFLLSDCTDLIFLDADVGSQGKSIVALAQYDRDVVAGIYPKKHGDDSYPVRMIPGEIWSDRDGLIEAEGVPTGFLRIRRNVLERLAAEAVQYNARNDAGSAIPLIFERAVIDGVRWGGDYMFCRKWRDIGGKIYIDPSLRFEHSGEHTWTGNVGAWLRQRSGIALDSGLRAFREGREKPEDALSLFDAWNNPFSATPEILLALAAVVRATKGPILECGAGLSTLVMAAAAPGREIHSLEQSPIHADNLAENLAHYGLTNAKVHRVNVPDWYDMSSVPSLDWGLVILDGPRGKSGRMGALSRLDLSRAVVVADDVQGDGGVPAMTRGLARTHSVVVVGDRQRQFAIAAPKRAAVGMAAE